MNMPKLANIFLSAFISCTLLASCSSDAQNKQSARSDTGKKGDQTKEEVLQPIDTAVYDSLMRKMANGDTTGKWPVKSKVYPKDGAILPYKRIVAYYGNLYSKNMGILGELPPKQMLARLDGEVKKWEKADPGTPVQPALHYIAVVAQGDGGKDGKYRFRMPEKQIDSVMTISRMRPNMIVFLDIQVSLSTIRDELPRLEKYLKLPNVHLGIDPEFSMKDGSRPGKRIGTYDAADINYCINYLGKLVKDNNLPPKVFVVHRFTKKMVTNSANIKPTREVQVVMHMDGWGEPELKKGTYRHFIYSEPVQFTGFKLFYKNDLKKAPNRLMTPDELVKLKPKPVYIQYQ
ncbi:hypothetical protein C7T94_07165 [Pedobacter yulinensis]|uniref:Lipoprotein n=1 Tax=Pedobacter yulinensis TaxID=2126353 RepID=A0A2T3HQ15_9SPHI|nr:hypothetical protein [Pedobacter yulinensis]PST84554.1 hypothetical protein C7T94_07165 [Pedobacter yulinensis]